VDKFELCFDGQNLNGAPSDQSWYVFKETSFTVVLYISRTVT